MRGIGIAPLMSLRREAAKFVVGLAIRQYAPGLAADLRRSARSNSPGVVRKAKRSMAQAADSASENPEPVVKLVEALYDFHMRKAQNRKLSPRTNW
jgi:hypothetical protein